ncbi:MAG TPA: pyrroline-5-carboxylate reductase [Sumerlaeia bacterium]|nr:pyrroline-5-carboxylate reductase [Sumerlaeia bacterium]
MTAKRSLGFVGVGNMGAALARGVVQSGLLPPERVWVSDVDPGKTRRLADELKVRVAEGNRDLLARTDTPVLAVKPQGFSDLLDELAPAAESRHLFISIAAGVPVRAITRRLGRDARVVRVMPNTPALIGCGATGVARGGGATDADLQWTLEIFNSVGVAVEVREEQINAVTGLSGSGPAYVFHLVEALTRAGEKAGLAPETAAALTRQTLLGAARMVCESGIDPAELRRRVTSPGGTTEAGLKILADADFLGLIERMVARATERGAELARMAE